MWVNLDEARDSTRERNLAFEPEKNRSFCNFEEIDWYKKSAPASSVPLLTWKFDEHSM